MTINLKKVLLAGTAIVAVAVSSAAAQAADLTMTANDDWADANAGVLDAAAAGDNVNLGGFQMNVFNNGTNNDGGGANLFTIGAITDSGASGDVLIYQSAGNTTAMNVDITSVTVNGDFTVQNDNTSNALLDVDVTGAATIGGALTLTNNETSAATDVDMDVDGALTVTGATTLTAGAFAGADAILTVGGNATFTGGVTLNANLGDARLIFDGTSAQTVTGTVVGAAAGEGDILVQNTSSGGVTFNSALGGTSLDQITISNNGNNVSATFKAAVTTTNGVVLGNGAGTDTNTATFDGTTAGFTVTGTVNGTAGDTDNVVITGGNTIVQAGIWGGVSTIDALTISGSSTLDSNAAITATATTIGSGSTLDVGAGLLTSAVTANGTLLLSGAGGVTGNINGTGTLDVNASASVTGSIGDTTDLTSITIAAGQTLTVVGGAARNVDATTLTLEGAAANLTLDTNGSAYTVGSTITAGVAGEGVVTITDDNAGSVAFTGNIGASGSNIDSFTFTTGANTVTASTTGNIYADALSIGENDTLSFLGTGTASQVVAGTINALGAANRGTLTIGNGTTSTPTVTFNGVIGGTNDLAGLNITTGSTAIFAAAGNNGFDGAMDLDGTLQINSGSILDVAGAYNSTADANAGTWNIGVKRTAGTDAIGTFTSAGALNLTADTGNIVVEAGSQPLVGGTVINNVITGGTVTQFGTLTDNSFLYSFTLTDVGADNDLDLTVTQATTVAETATSSANESVGNVLVDDLSASTNTEINLIQGNLAAAGTQEAVNEILEASTSTVDGGAMVSSLTVNNTVLGISGDRLASLRSGTAETGMAAGNMGQGLHWWAQGFGQMANQDRRDGVDGYDADTWGVAVGIDSENIADNGTIGVAFSYGDTEVDSDNATRTRTNVDSYQLTLYGSYDMTEAMYLDGMVAYAWNDVDTTRTNVGGVAGLVANGDYDADQFTARVEVGRDYQHGNTTWTPNALAHWTHYSPDSYTETGAGGANLTVDQDGVNVFELGVGVDASWLFQNANGSKTKPVLRVGYRYDLVGDEVQSSNNFQAGGPAFAAEGPDPAKSTFTAGASVTYYSTDNWDLSANYDFDYKSDYDSHSGFLRAGYKF